MTPIDTEAPPLPSVAVDARGKIVPLTDEQRRAQSEALRRFMEDLADEPDDDPPGNDAEFFRAMDAERPHRPFYEGMY